MEAETTWWVEVCSSRCARYTYPLTVRGALPPLSALHASSSLLLLRSFLRIRALLPSHEESRCAHVPARRNTSSSSRFTLSLLRLLASPLVRRPALLLPGPSSCSFPACLLWVFSLTAASAPLFFRPGRFDRPPRLIDAEFYARSLCLFSPPPFNPYDYFHHSFSYSAFTSTTIQSTGIEMIGKDRDIRDDFWWMAFSFV